MVRSTGRYAYPFLNVMRLGWERTAVNAVLIAVGIHGLRVGDGVG